MRVHISVWVEFASVYMFFTLLEPKALMINDAAYIAARGGPQVPHKDLKPRAVNAVKDTVVLSVFVVLTHCPHDGQHGGWVAGHTFLSFFSALKRGCQQLARWDSGAMAAGPLPRAPWVGHNFELAHT